MRCDAIADGDTLLGVDRSLFGAAQGNDYGPDHSLSRRRCGKRRNPHFSHSFEPHEGDGGEYSLVRLLAAWQAQYELTLRSSLRRMGQDAHVGDANMRREQVGPDRDRQSVEEGKSGAVRGDLGCSSIIKK